MKSLKVLIVGGGVGGPVAAYWLARAGHEVTIVERYPALRAGGTQIDLRNQAVEIVKRMGLYEAIHERTIPEAGIAFVDRNNKTRAFWPGAGSEDGTSFFTQEIEIMRGDLVRILYAATKDTVKYMFGKTVESYVEDSESVTATFSDGTQESYDLLIGADGLGSRIRRSMLGPDAKGVINSLNLYLAYWFIPKDKSDTDVARMFYSPGRKVSMLRSTKDHSTQAYFGIQSESEEMRSLTKLPENEQREFWIKLFQGAGWETERMISGLKSTKDFYCTEVAQVKSPIWSKGRVALCGDAGYCPSPATGIGTATAVIGAYVLAGEIATRPDDLRTALEKYETTLRPYVKEAQDVPAMMNLFTPETERGIAVLAFLMKVISWAVVVINWLKIDVLWERLSPDRKKLWKLPTYSALS